MTSRSKIGKHLRYLLRLREADRPTRMEMIRNISTDKMAAIAELVTLILNRDIGVWDGDHHLFLQNIQRLRQIASPSISLARKKRALLNKHILIPKLLRERHLEFALLHFLRQSED